MWGGGGIFKTFISRDLSRGNRGQNKLYILGEAIFPLPTTKKFHLIHVLLKIFTFSCSPLCHVQIFIVFLFPLQEGSVIFGEPIAASLACNGSHYYHTCWRHAAAYVLSPPLRHAHCPLKAAILNPANMIIITLALHFIFCICKTIFQLIVLDVCIQNYMLTVVKN